MTAYLRGGHLLGVAVDPVMVHRGSGPPIWEARVYNEVIVNEGMSVF